jgi:hypothetical protein
MAAVIYIDNEGNLTGLADDVWDKFSSLGERLVARVSNIEFDHEHQCWVAVDMDGQIIASNPVRSEVIAAERAYFNKCIERGFTG